MSNVPNPFGFFPSFKLSAGRDLQACGYKFAKRKRLLIGYLCQELINVLMWLYVFVTSCPKLQLCGGPTFNKWWPCALIECALRYSSSRLDSSQM